MPTSATNDTLLDGISIPSTNFTVLGASGYCGAHILLTNSAEVHLVTSSQPVAVEASGWGTNDSYGYLSGIVK